MEVKSSSPLTTNLTAESPGWPKNVSVQPETSEDLDTALSSQQGKNPGKTQTAAVPLPMATSYATPAPQASFQSTPALPPGDPLLLSLEIKWESRTFDECPL